MGLIMRYPPESGLDGLDFPVELGSIKYFIGAYHWCNTQLVSMVPDVEWISIPFYNPDKPFLRPDDDMNAYVFYFNSESAALLFKLQGF